MTDSETICPVCRMDKNVKRIPTQLGYYYECPRCREYNIDRRAERTIGRDPDEEKRMKISALIRNNYEVRKEPYIIDWETFQKIESFLPDYGVLEKQLRLLQNISRRSLFPGFEVAISPELDYPLAWASSGDELRFHLKSLYNRGFFEVFEESEPPLVVISASGWEYLDKHESDIEGRTQVFVAMSFNPELNSVWENAIRPAIKDAGYTAYRIDKEPHNERIDAKIMAEIKNSRFIVADFTENKHGVYFEAGYALGLGIPVLWCVKEGKDLDEVRFDTRQYNHIAWKDEKDLKEKLFDFICAIIGKRK